LGTASERGTVIRIWTVPQGNCVKELRRGMYACDVKQLSFSMDANYLALISSNSTIHVWETKSIRAFEDLSKDYDVIAETPVNQKQTSDDDIFDKEGNMTNNILSEQDNSWYSYLSSIANTVYSTSATVVDVAYNLTTGGVIDRAKFTCKVPINMSAKSVAISSNNLILYCNEGQMVVYDFVNQEGLKRTVSAPTGPTKPKQSISDEIPPGELKIVNIFNLNEDDRIPQIKHETAKKCKSVNYASIASKHLTRQTSKQIEVDLTKNNLNLNLENKNNFPSLGK